MYVYMYISSHQNANSSCPWVVGLQVGGLTGIFLYRFFYVFHLFHYDRMSMLTMFSEVILAGAVPTKRLFAAPPCPEGRALQRCVLTV